jgi:hypothetical protein
MKTFKKVKNCGPVPYPDQSGRMLTDGVVTGDEWLPLMALGFVELIDPNVPAEPVPVPAQESPVPPTPKPAVKKKNFNSVLDNAYMAEMQSAVQTGTRSDSILGKALKAEQADRAIRESKAKVKEKVEKVENAESADDRRTEEMDTQTIGGAVSISTTKP